MQQKTITVVIDKTAKVQSIWRALQAKAATRS